ncbi:MAG: TIGR03620 family F420-dependent LLM class oxidoreductase [Sphingomonadales bacterium]|nr:TIGR03620 family F420-dependent LLM class oxidoreductase [Sphingomonadales bacterium]
MTVPNLGRYGIWSMELRFGDPSAIGEACAELEELGFGALWVPGGIGGDVTGDLDRLLNASSRMVIATGIINVWKHEPAEIADWFTALSPDRQARLMLGLGISHGPLIGEAWQKPLAKMTEWIGQLVAAGVPADAQCVAALRPKMLELSGKLTAGAHPYLIDVEHSRRARAILGPGKLLAPEQGVILETDRDTIRELAGIALTHYARLPNYCNSWLALGYTQDDIDTISDRFIDGIFATGTPEQVKARLDAHLEAGASHVCAQVITAPGTPLDQTRAKWRTLAQVLL